MPWKDVSVMDQRMEFVRLALAGGVPVAELCRRFGISRDTGHRLLRRFREAGEAGLAERSRRPVAMPTRTAPEVEAAVLAVRAEHPVWGGRKIARRLGELGIAAPAPSTVTAVLHRAGRIAAGASAAHQAHVRFEHPAPNALWQMDFKGWFATGAGRCHPLTVLDDHSRYALALEACPDERFLTVQSRLAALFRRHGLPERILCDNGAPWGVSPARAPLGWTACGVWLLRLGVRLGHGRPHHPQTQGKAERFHRTLKAECLALRRFDDLAACQSAFDTWRHLYNHVRPHEALGLDTPASRYRPSPRPMPDPVPLPDYAEGEIVRRVRRDGYLHFQGRSHAFREAFAGYDVALRPAGNDGTWTICFASHPVATLDLRSQGNQTRTVRHVPEHLSDISPV
jgi:transposase InsO family protein